MQFYNIMSEQHNLGYNPNLAPMPGYMVGQQPVAPQQQMMMQSQMELYQKQMLYQQMM